MTIFVAIINLFLILTIGYLLGFSPKFTLAQPRLIVAKTYSVAPDGTPLATVEVTADGRILVKYRWGPKKGTSVLIDVPKSLEEYWLENKPKPERALAAPPKERRKTMPRDADKPKLSGSTVVPFPGGNDDNPKK